MCGKIVLLRVFENQHSPFAQQIAAEHQVDDPFAPLQVVGGVREDDVEALRATLQVEEDIGLDDIHVVDAELRGRLTDEVVVHRIDFDRRDAPCSARGKLVADGARAGEEVEYVALLEVDQIAQHVEEVLLGKIGGRPCTQVARRVDGTSLVFSADYSHTIRL